MKLKNNFIVFFISIITILAFRVYEIVNMNSLKTTSLQFIETICLACMILSSILIIFMSYLSKNITQKFKLKKNNFLSLLSFITGVFLVINGVSDVLTLFTASSVEIILLFTGIFSILSGVIFFVLGRNFSSAQNTFFNHQLIILIPVAWLTLRLYQLFLQYRIVRMQVQSMSVELSVIFLLLYFMHFAKLFSGIYNQKVYKKLFMYGLLGSIFVFMSVTYNLFEMALSSVFGISEIISLITDLILAAFVVSFVYFLSKNAEEASNKNLELESDIDPKKDSHEETSNKNFEPESNIDPEKDSHDKMSNQSMEIKNEEVFESTSGGNSKTFDMESINKLIDDISK